MLDQDRDHNHVNEIDVDDDHSNAAGASITASTGTNWFDPTYDDAGNITTVPYPASPANGLTLKYDAWNRLASAQYGELWELTFEYDGLNRRIVKGYDFGEQGQYYDYLYHNASWQLLERRYNQGQGGQPETVQPYWQYVWSARYIDSPVLRDENTDTDGLCDDGRIYYLTDANFNVTTLVDTGGDAIERYLYDPYGKATIYNGDWSATRSYSSYGNHILYTGRELDLNTGLYYYRNRYYHPGLGRFVSRDPIGLAARERNVYAYVGNCPTILLDPDGLQAVQGRLVSSSRRVPNLGPYTYEFTGLTVGTFYAQRVYSYISINCDEEGNKSGFFSSAYGADIFRIAQGARNPRDRHFINVAELHNQFFRELVLQHHFRGTVFRCFASQRFRCDFLASRLWAR